MDKDTTEWIFELFEEIEEPTPRDRAQLLSLLLAETESWSNVTITDASQKRV